MRDQLQNHQKPWRCSQKPTSSIGSTTAPSIWSFITRGEGKPGSGPLDVAVLMAAGFFELGMVAARTDGITAKRPPAKAGGRLNAVTGLSTQTDLGEDALAGEEFGGKTDHEAEHGKAAVPGFGEADEAEARGVVSHG